MTLIFGSLSAILEKSIKKVVAYSTLSQMGLACIVYGFGLFNFGFLNLISHGFAKSLLFIQVGYMIHLKMNQQEMRKWSNSSNSEGLLRIQLICTLISLCGTSFLRGILSKERILERVNNNSWFLLVFIGVIFGVYITFVYSIIIYNSLFRVNFYVCQCHGSYIIIVVTWLELILVVMWFN